MQVSHIKIENFRGIRYLEAKFDSKFVCLVGSGDSGKSTILTAIEYALSPRWNLNFDDSDFFRQDVTNSIRIAVTLTDWDDTSPDIKKFFSEGSFGLFLGGINIDGVISEPIAPAKPCLTIQLEITNTLEPSWVVIKNAETKPITAADRSTFALSRIDNFLDNNFTWGRNTFLTKLSTGKTANLNIILSEIARSTKNSQINLQSFETLTSEIEVEAKKMGVNLGSLSPKIDIQKVSLASGALSLHEAEVPLRNHGTGSKKLISCAIQSKINHGKNITLIDELETGLEPHRIRGLIEYLKKSNQQIITTTHSPVVLRKLKVSDNNLYVCRKDITGNVTIQAVNDIPELQSSVRSNAEAFLGTKIIVCEGPTEIGCLRALDELKSKTTTPVWTLNTSYYNAGGIGNVRLSATKLKKLGYDVIVFCDNDTPSQFTEQDQKDLEDLGILVICWKNDNSIELQLFEDIEWSALPGFFEALATIKDVTLSSLIQSVVSKIDQLPIQIHLWEDTSVLRRHLGLIAGAKNLDETPNKNWSSWFKRIELAEDVFRYALPNLKNNSLMLKKLDSLWSLVQI